MRLICLPHAGGGASTYLGWARKLRDAGVELVAVQPPGRENRSRETALTDLCLMASQAASAIIRLQDKKYALFGHSMGALVAYEVAKCMLRQGARLPELLIVSGAAPPQTIRSCGELHRIKDDEEFIRTVAATFEGIPDRVLHDSKIRQAVIGQLRGDLQAIERYSCEAAVSVPFDICAYTGVDDPLVGETSTREWADLTTKSFEHRRFAGNHWFIARSRDAVLMDIRARLTRDRPRCTL